VNFALIGQNLIQS